MNKEYINAKLTYSCNHIKYKECPKTICAYCYEDGYGCKHTSKYKYAKKNPLNFIKKIINKMRGTYKYD